MKVKVNDKVMVISGKDKGKSGRILRISTKSNRVVVEKLNMRTKHIKKTQQRAGERIHFEALMSVSNVALICPSCNKPTRIGYKILESGKKDRICKKCKDAVDRGIVETSTPKAKSTTKKLKTL